MVARSTRPETGFTPVAQLVRLRIAATETARNQRPDNRIVVFNSALRHLMSIGGYFTLRPQATGDAELNVQNTKTRLNEKRQHTGCLFLTDDARLLCGVCGRLGTRCTGVALTELLDAACRIHDLVLAGIKRMRFR